ncbi:hypothetical protein ASE90_02400 [Sphingomonas sp. Leaf67]|nr:hypothetical protein ASE90_02400 [Sphingomonas sp. Leaf67]
MRGKGRLIGGAGFALSIFLVASWFLGLCTGGTMMTWPRPFSSVAWKQVDTSFSEDRCRMILDLRYRVGLEGRTPSEVIALLGDEREGRAGPPTHYVLCPTLADYLVLELRWRDGRVGSSRIYQS